VNASRPLTIPTELSHYRILGPLGKGGMGEVFAAEDTRLYRKAAIKVLTVVGMNLIEID
jgi:serine/threonine protein kinase